MLRVLIRYVAWLRSMSRTLNAIERRDRNLGQQLRRAKTSVALNLSEGSGSEGGTRRQRYLNALGSAHEVHTGLGVALAFCYVEVPQDRIDELNEIIAIITALAKPRGG